jgi:sensor histidine kinase YesM
VQYFVMSGRIVTTSPLAAPGVSGVSLLDESAKVLLLALAGAVATYATAWHERLAISYFRQARDREHLEARLARAQLQTLKLQLQPHFLFNTLNAVSGLAVDGDTRGTIRTLALLGDLLRATLQRSEQVVSVAEELELLDLYLAIQRVRLEERLEVRTHIDPAVMSAEIPTFLLQPLVENAIRHGIAPSSQHGWIEIAASRQRDRVALTITDSGCGVGTEPIRLGVGLSNCIERLSQLYGSQYSFDLGDVATGGARVRVEWPWRQRPSGAPHRSESGMPDSMRDTEISDPAGSRRPARVP